MKRTEEQWETWEFPLESKLRDYVTKRLKQARLDGHRLYITKISDRHIGGVSDFIGCANGRFIAIELKRKGNTPTGLQVNYIDEVRKAGGIAGVCYNWKHVKELLGQAGIDLDK